ncbi:fumarylacetoacetate hydrolase family protein [Amycolatopsis sp. cmx-4-61]|uniref:fumarylacetoacetate hydrolase family protein n=1 Tax=Amycolatopsis sp. cmx-4-61 TaxID=2790937 RepID=UPI00397E2B09
MRIVNAAGRLGLLGASGVVDVAEASGGRFSPDPQAAYDVWPDLLEWAGGMGEDVAARPLVQAELGAPAPWPRQVFAIGLNYLDHAEEAGIDVVPDSLVVFGKYASAITGADAEVEIPPGSVDYEAELVVVIGKRAHRIDATDAWSHVAGLTVGQDLSERELQLRPPTPQFSLGKSFPGFAPMGPALVTPDEFADPDDLAITCTLNGETVQNSRTKLMIHPIAQIIARLSETVPLLPGDVVFTGTPAGIGFAREPRLLIKPGDELITAIEGIGSIRTRFR